MTSAEMWQEFQVLTDTLDTQNLPDIPVEVFFILVNLAVDEYMQAARIAFETTRKVGDDVAPLVKRGFILPILVDDRVTFPYSKILTELPSPSTPKYLSSYYMLNGLFRSTWTNGEVKHEGTSELVYYQQDDITVNSPFKHKLLDKIPVVLENNSIVVPSIPKNVTLDVLVGTFLEEPAKINQTTNCNLAKQLHHTVVKRAVEIALENIESIRQKTFNQ